MTRESRFDSRLQIRRGSLERGDLTEVEWRILRVLLPVERELVSGRGHPPEDNLNVINGILWRLRTGAPWRDVPEKYSNWNSIYRRFWRWSASRVWESVTVALAETMAESGHYNIDSTTVRARVSAAGGKGGFIDDLLPARAGTDARGRPIAFHLTPGEAADCRAYEPLICLPEQTPDALIADRAYDADVIRDDPKKRGIRPVIPPKSNRTKVIRYSKRLCHERNCVERMFGHLKINRAIATRYDQLADSFLGRLFLASAPYWLKIVHAV